MRWQYVAHHIHGIDYCASALGEFGESDRIVREAAKTCLHGYLPVNLAFARKHAGAEGVKCLEGKLRQLRTAHINCPGNKEYKI